MIKPITVVSSTQLQRKENRNSIQLETLFQSWAEVVDNLRLICIIYLPLKR